MAVTGYVSPIRPGSTALLPQTEPRSPPRWLVNIVLFFSINVLNNHAFSYDISVPVHIILRSGGSITTMLAGYTVGKRSLGIQVMAVMLLTIGVVIAAWSDPQSKVACSLPISLCT